LFKITFVKSDSTHQKGRGNVRIIGGQWRGRRLSTLPGDQVRPTPDRVRETLFNWLMPVVAGARCLDLFAGTGALGIEAISRGAASAWFVERDETVAGHLEGELTRLQINRDRLVRADAIRFLEGAPKAFDIVFLDPPFDGYDLANLCKLLEQGWLAPGAHIYFEMHRKRDLPLLSNDWRIVRDKSAGQVRYALAQRP
jgi:16S rRNA (guanine966-N2)-methyltransferase